MPIVYLRGVLNHREDGDHAEGEAGIKGSLTDTLARRLDPARLRLFLHSSAHRATRHGRADSTRNQRLARRPPERRTAGGHHPTAIGPCGASLPGTVRRSRPIRCHHANVHHWRNAGPAVDCDDSFDSDEFWWDEALGIGVCGNFFAGAEVATAWHCGAELADCMAASQARAKAKSGMIAAMR